MLTQTAPPRESFVRGGEHHFGFNWGVATGGEYVDCDVTATWVVGSSLAPGENPHWTNISVAIPIDGDRDITAIFTDIDLQDICQQCGGDPPGE